MVARKEVIAITVFLYVISLSASAYGQASVNNVYTIPPNFSKNLPVVLVAETSILENPSYVGWNIVNDPHLGSFNKLSASKWVCYFSNTEKATCGSVPFKEGGSGVTYDLDITSFSATQESPTKEFLVSPGELDLVIIDEIIQENLLFIAVAGRNAVVTGTPTYNIYNSNDLSLFDSGSLIKRNFTGDYQLNRSLPSGSYYIAFEFNSDKGKGGFSHFAEIGGAAATGSLSANPVDAKATLALGESFTKDYEIQNTLNQKFENLSAEVASDIKNIVKIVLSQTTILPQETVKYTIRADNIKTALFISSFFDLYSGTGTAKTLLNKIPINLKIDLSGQGAIEDRPVLVLDSPIWTSRDYLLSDEVSTEITVRNSGSGDLEITGVEAKDGLSNTILSSILPTGKITTTGTITLKLKPTSAGAYSGKVVVKSNGGDKDVFVNIRVYENMESEIENLKSSVNAQKNLLKNKHSNDVINILFSTIDLYIQNAENSANINQYADAQESLTKAKAQLDVVTKLPDPPAGIDPLIIIAVVIVIAVVLIVYKKKLFSKKKKEESDEYEDEYTDEELNEEY